MKQKLTVEKAKKIAEEKGEEIARKNKEGIDPKEYKEFFLQHSKLVGDIALILAEKKNVDKELLRIVGWIHDIGKAIDDENHAEHSVELIKKEYEIDDKLRDCILNHGPSGKPKTEEGKVIKVADKAAFLNPEFISLLVKYSKKKIKKEDIKFIRRIVNSAVDLLEEFELE